MSAHCRGRPGRNGPFHSAWMSEVIPAAVSTPPLCICIAIACFHSAGCLLAIWRLHELKHSLKCSRFLCLQAQCSMRYNALHIQVHQCVYTFHSTSPFSLTLQNIEQLHQYSTMCQSLQHPTTLHTHPRQQLMILWSLWNLCVPN